MITLKQVPHNWMWKESYFKKNPNFDQHIFIIQIVGFREDGIGADKWDFAKIKAHNIFFQLSFRDLPVEEFFDLEKVSPETRKEIQWLIKGNNFDENDKEHMALYFETITGSKWKIKRVKDYEEGYYCDVIYDTAVFSDEEAEEAGMVYLDIAVKFEDNNGNGYIVPKELLKNPTELKKELAKKTGYNSEEIEVLLFEDEVVVPKYKSIK